MANNLNMKWTNAFVTNGMRLWFVFSILLPEILAIPRSDVGQETEVAEIPYARKTWSMRRSIGDKTAQIRKTFYKRMRLHYKGQRTLSGNKNNIGAFNVYIFSEEVSIGVQKYGPYMTGRPGRVASNLSSANERRVLTNFQHTSIPNSRYHKEGVHYTDNVNMNVQPNVHNREPLKGSPSGQVAHLRPIRKRRRSTRSIKHASSRLHRSLNRRKNPPYEIEDVSVDPEETELEAESAPGNASGKIRIGDIVMPDMDALSQEPVKSYPKTMPDDDEVKSRKQKKKQSAVDLSVPTPGESPDDYPEDLTDYEPDSTIEVKESKRPPKTGGLFAQNLYKYAPVAKGYARRRGLFQNLSRLDEDLLQLQINLL